MKPVRVFIVDDDEDFAESMGMVLESRGYEVELAYSGEEAISKFSEQDFDIAFMDVKLPGKNGVDSFLEIRKFKPYVKVVMITAYSVEQLLDQAVENGAWGILHKPFDIQKVLKMIEKLSDGGILIADDDPDFVQSIKDLLISKGYNVFVARNGREAIEYIRANGFDVLILDLRMPILDGLETYLELRRLGHSIPTIIVTAFADDESKAINTLRSMEVSGILTKPFDPGELLEVIEKLSRMEKE